MLIWTPPLNTNTSSSCLYLNQNYLASRPPISHSTAMAHSSFLIVTLVFVIMVHIVLFRLRREPRIRVRPQALLIIASIGILIGITLVSGRRSDVDPVTGQAEMRCVTFATWFLIYSPIIAASLLVRYLQELFRYRYTCAIGRLRNTSTMIVSNMEDAGEVPVTTTTQSPPPHDLVVMVRLTPGTFFALLRSVFMDKTTDASSVTTRKLAILSLATRPETQLAFFCFLLLPVAITIIILYSYVPLLNSSCPSCDVFGELLIARLIGDTFLSSLFFKVGRELHGHDDLYGVKKELTLILLLGSPLIICGWILFALDPQHLDYDNVFPWEYFQVMGLLCIFMLMGPVQIILAVKEKLAIDPTPPTGILKCILQCLTPIYSYVSSAPALRMEFAEGMADDHIRAAFVEFGKTAYISESITFLQDAKLWKGMFEERSEQWHRTKAELLTSLYIRHRAPLQINISAHVRNTIEAKVNNTAEHLRHTLFDDAIEELTVFLAFQHWRDFVRTPAAVEVMAQSSQRRIAMRSSVNTSSSGTSPRTPRKTPAFRSGSSLSPINPNKAGVGSSHPSPLLVSDRSVVVVVESLDSTE